MNLKLDAPYPHTPAIRAGLPPDEHRASPRRNGTTRPLSCIAFVILFTAAFWAGLFYAAGAFLRVFGAPI